MLKRRQESNIDERSTVIGVLLFALPGIITYFFQMMYSAVDIVVVGRYCGETSIAAVGTTSALYNLVITFFMGFGAGVSALVARHIGAQDDERTHDAVHTSFAFAIACGIALTLFGMIFGRNLLVAMYTPKNIIDHATLYLQIILAGSPGNLVYTFGTAIMRSNGDSKRPMYFLALSGIIHIILDLFFTVVLGISVIGVALASTISQYISGLLAVGALLKMNSSCRLFIRDVRFHANELKSIIIIGFPAGLQYSIYGLSNVFIQSKINLFGSKAISGFSAAASVSNFAIGAMEAFSDVTIVYVAHSYGARNFGKIRRLTNICLIYAFSIGTLMGMAIAYFGKHFLGIYVRDNAEVISIGVKYLAVFKFTTGFSGGNEVTTSALRGMKHPFAPTLTSIVGICIFRAVWLETVFVKWHTLEMIFLSYPISFVITGIVNVLSFYRVWSKERRKTCNEMLV